MSTEESLLCCERVVDTSGWHTHRCRNKAKFDGPKGRVCAIHSPAYKAKVRERQEAAFERKMKPFKDASEVPSLKAQIAHLQSQLDECRKERDALRAEVAAAKDEAEKAKADTERLDWLMGHLYAAPIKVSNYYLCPATEGIGRGPTPRAAIAAAIDAARTP